MINTLKHLYAIGGAIPEYSTASYKDGEVDERR